MVLQRFRHSCVTEHACTDTYYKVQETSFNILSEPIMENNLTKNIYTHIPTWKTPGTAGGSDGKESACSVGDLGLIPG